MDLNQFALAQTLGSLCCEQKLHLALAESCTGGAVSQVITSVPESSKWFEAGFVVYSNTAKSRMLGVDPELIVTHGAVSEPVVMAMAKGVLNQSVADLAVAITGIAGPHGGSADKPVGTVWFAIADRKQGTCRAISQFFESGREHIRRCATVFALNLLLDHIQQ